MSNQWLELSSLSFTYGENLSVFESMDLSVSEKVRSVGVVGRSGVGKSTFINLLAGFLAPGSGEIRFAGELVTG